MAVRRITGDRPGQRGRRARRSAALAATVPFLAVLGVQAQGASAAPAERPVSVVTQGLNNHQACLIVGVNPTTGMRWS